ncbi:hypothetical protein GCM10009841_02350 [Microlunatus panaciterrae]|uniref:Uncharacterized protein n=1 Tax=Microlunatus panaciterrae TaxID=400768 RepID=A0ABS2RJC3_9ACTN|nr:hypothetical protein [Microlunatus panaciterrae]MBM7799100.1 hypothetical protein [Microlunatus panaciterrae]
MPTRSSVPLRPTNILVGPYTVLAVIAYTLFGIGQACYTTRSTDAAVRQAGLVTFMLTLMLALIAIISIALTIPKGRKYHE